MVAQTDVSLLLICRATFKKLSGGARMKATSPAEPVGLVAFDTGVKRANASNVIFWLNRPNRPLENREATASASFSSPRLPAHIRPIHRVVVRIAVA